MSRERAETLNKTLALVFAVYSASLISRVVMMKCLTDTFHLIRITIFIYESSNERVKSAPSSKYLAIAFTSLPGQRPVEPTAPIFGAFSAYIYAFLSVFGSVLSYSCPSFVGWLFFPNIRYVAPRGP